MSKNSPSGFLCSLNVAQNSQSVGSGGNGSSKGSGLNTSFGTLAALLRSSLLSACDGICPVSRRSVSEWNETKTLWCSHSDHANHYYAWCHFTRGVFHFPGLATCNLEYHLVKFGGLWMWRMMHHSSWATLKLDTIERPWYLMIFGRGKEGKRSGGGEKETHAKPFVLLLSSSKMLVQAWAVSSGWNLWSSSGC